jgi:hypothetical protein
MKETGNTGSSVCLSDDFLFEEVAKRLRRNYQREHGLPFQYGSFEFIFHQGRFQSIEERPRNKRYVSPPKTPATGGQL